MTERRPKLDESATTNKTAWDLDQRAGALAGNVYDPAAICVAESTKKCAEGLAVLKSQCKNVKISGCEEATTKNWAAQKDRLKIDCK